MIYVKPKNVLQHPKPNHRDFLRQLFAAFITIFEVLIDRRAAIGTEITVGLRLLGIGAYFVIAKSLVQGIGLFV